MKIGIVIPMYNCSKSIARTINSIIQQDYYDYRVVLINDGSNDDTASIVENIIKDNEKFELINIKNHGVSHARNIGLDILYDVDIIMFADSDDELMPNSFKKIVEEINEYDLVCFSYYENKKLINLKSYDIINNKQEYYEILSKKLLFNQLWNKVYKRNKIGNIRFNEKLNLGEDLDFNIRYLENIEKFKYSSFPIYKYNLFNNGLSYKKRKNILDVKIEMLENVKAFYEKNNFVTSYLSILYQKAFVQGLIYRYDIVTKSNLINYNKYIIKKINKKYLKSNSLIMNYVISKLQNNSYIVYFFVYNLYYFYNLKKSRNKGEK